MISSVCPVCVNTSVCPKKPCPFKGVYLKAPLTSFEDAIRKELDKKSVVVGGIGKIDDFSLGDYDKGYDED
jgi:hypothetical protein